MPNTLVRTLLLAAITSAGCSSSTTPLVCPDDPPRVNIEPVERTVPAGTTYTAVAEARICGGTRVTPFVGIWRSANPSVAVVDTATGVISGVAPGVTYVYAQYVTPSIPSAYGHLDSLRVRVP